MKVSPVVKKLTPAEEATIQSGDTDYDRGRHRMPWGAWEAHELTPWRNGAGKGRLRAVSYRTSWRANLAP